MISSYINNKLAPHYLLLSILLLTSSMLTFASFKLGAEYRPGLMFSYLIFLALVIQFYSNVLFLARTLILGIIGLYPSFVKLAFGEGAYFSFYEVSTQGMDIVMIMFLATSIALFGSCLGIWLSRIESLDAAKFKCRETGQSSLWKFAFWISLPVVVWISFITIESAGQNIFLASYATTAQGQLLGNAQNIGLICLLTMFVASRKVAIPGGTFLVLSMTLLLLVWAMFLRGLRQDVVTALLGLIVCSALTNRRDYNLNLSRIVVIVTVMATVELMGIARVVVSAPGFNLNMLLDSYLETFSRSDTYHFGTVSPISSTFANTIYLLDNGIISYKYGVTYLEYLARTPPEFIYPSRPQDYSWMFLEHGLISGGGFFELAEAYYNFGLLGCLLMPLLVSYLIGKSYYYTKNRQTLISYFLLFSFLGIFLRGTWYQIFAFYKSFVTAMIIYVCLVCLYQLLIHASYFSIFTGQAQPVK